jgi:chromosome partitioning protein
VLIPVQAEYFALEGLGQLLNTIKIVRQHLNPDLEIEGVLLTMFDTRLNLSNQVAQEVRRYFGEKVFETIVQRNVRLSEAPSFGKPAILYEASSKGAKNYMGLAREILEGNEEYIEQHHTNGEGTAAEETDDVEQADEAGSSDEAGPPDETDPVDDPADVEASSEDESGVTEAIGGASDPDGESPPADDFSL